VTYATVWHTDEECPVCAAGLVLLGHGGPVQVIECRACGYSERWDFTNDGNGGGAE
jgi:ribosomal protein S27AE